MKRLLVAAVMCLATASVAAAQDSYLLVVVGLGGDEENAARFHGWAVALVDAARTRYGLPASHVTYLGENPARDPGRIAGKSTREGIEAAVGRIAASARPGDRAFIVLIGHGATATGEPRFNLPGPDLTAAEFGRLLGRLAALQVVFVNTASASGSFIPALSGKDRAVVAATRTDGERNQTRFAEFFVEAYATDAGDIDKDGRISILEAFTWARRRVVESYERDGQLLTEHAVLDDDGDGKGTDKPGEPGADGALARTLFMTSGTSTVGSEQTADPELRALLEQQKALEGRIAALRAAKGTIEAAQYERDLEQLLVELARTSRAIKEKQKK
jgi:hypothetical protein